MRTGLYAIVDPAACRGRSPVWVTERIVGGGCSILQLRAKDLPDAETLELARQLRACCRAAGVAFVLNDRPDLAALAHADGVHLGQDDVPLGAARALLRGKMVGLSTHDLSQAREAASQGADLIAVGPIFPTLHKKNPDPVVGLSILGEICASVACPVVAIGGMDAHRAALAARRGAHLVAAIGALCGADDPRLAAIHLHRAVLQA